MSGRAQHHETNNTLEQHVALLRQQVKKSLDDPATRVFCSSIVSGNFDSMQDPRSGRMVPVVPYYGRWYRGAVSWEAASETCGQRSYDCEVTALWNAANLNLRYQQDQDGEDTYSTFRATMEQGGGDCDDLAVWFAAALKSMGYENVVFRIVSLDGVSWAHIYPLVMLPNGRWLALDMTEKGHYPGWEYKNIAAKRDFAV